MTDTVLTGAASTVPERLHPATHLPGEAGIWFFVAGDLLVFSLFFILLALGQAQQGALFDQSRARLDLALGLANTLLLLTGSWFVATGVERCRERSGSATRQFSLAILCALGFVADKALEWGHRIDAGITPATNDFFMYYFVFTGIHLFHVLIGIGVLLFLRSASQRAEMTPRTLRAIEAGATFWHLVDLLWVALFALLYLI